MTPLTWLWLCLSPLMWIVGCMVFWLMHPASGREDHIDGIMALSFVIFLPSWWAVYWLIQLCV